MTTDLRQLYEEAQALQHLLSDATPDVADAVERYVGRLLAYGMMKNAEVELLRHERQQMRGEVLWRFYTRSPQ